MELNVQNWVNLRLDAPTKVRGVALAKQLQPAGHDLRCHSRTGPPFVRGKRRMGTVAASTVRHSGAAKEITSLGLFTVPPKASR